jgi:hypothetical protein
VKDLFDHFSPKLGDDMTNSEDIFIGMAMLDKGYRNIQLIDVYARTVEPRFEKLFKQVYLWSSSFLQSCYYFDALLKSPFRWHKRVRMERWPRRGSRIPATVATAPAVASGLALGGPVLVPPRKVALGETAPLQMSATAVLDDVQTPLQPIGTNRSGRERRRIQEPYRQAFGRERTREFGRPAGWMLLTSATEKVFFPTVLLIMLLLRNWHGLFWTIWLETTVSLLCLVLVTRGRAWHYFFKGVAVIPLRYLLVASELVTMGVFATHLWVTRERGWRK